MCRPGKRSSRPALNPFANLNKLHSGQPQGCLLPAGSSYFQRTSGGIDIRIDSVRPPVCRAKQRPAIPHQIELRRSGRDMIELKLDAPLAMDWLCAASTIGRYASVQPIANGLHKAGTRWSKVRGIQIVKEQAANSGAARDDASDSSSHRNHF